VVGHLALKAPVARDLRIVISALRIVADVHRMGVLAIHIANTARRRHPAPVIPADVRPFIERMERIGVHLADQTEAVLRTEDLAVARRMPVDDDAQRLLEVTEKSLWAGLDAVRDGNRLSDIGHAVQKVAEAAGYGVVREYTGHGINETFHSGLVILHYDEPSVTTVLEKGMTFTIEPMITLGGIEWDLWDDGWTVTTRDRSWTAQFEHTLVVTDTGAEVLTRP
jgi:methionine aminopeptidase